MPGSAHIDRRDGGQDYRMNKGWNSLKETAELAGDGEELKGVRGRKEVRGRKGVKREKRGGEGGMG